MTKRKTPREFSYSFKLQVLIDYYYCPLNIEILIPTH